MAERKGVTRQMVLRYAGSSKKRKAPMLDELCALTRWSRGSCPKGAAARPPAIGAEEAGTPAGLGPRGSRPLRFIWATLDASGKRLQPFLAEALETLERAGERRMDGSVRVSESDPRPRAQAAVMSRQTMRSTQRKTSMSRWSLGRGCRGAGPSASANWSSVICFSRPKERNRPTFRKPRVDKASTIRRDAPGGGRRSARRGSDEAMLAHPHALGQLVVQAALGR
jgi:hypothetical protein